MSGDEPVGRSIPYKIVHCSSPTLSRNHQGNVLDERPGIAEILDTFASGPLVGLAPACDYKGRAESRPISWRLMTSARSGPRYAKSNLFSGSRRHNAKLCLLNEHERVPFEDRVALPTVIWRTMPLVTARIARSIFIASRTSCCSSWRTWSPSLTSTETMVP